MDRTIQIPPDEMQAAYESAVAGQKRPLMLMAKGSVLLLLWEMEGRKPPFKVDPARLYIVSESGISEAPDAAD